MADSLTLTIRGREFTVDWGYDRDPTPAEVETIAKAIAAKEFGSKPRMAKFQEREPEYVDKKPTSAGLFGAAGAMMDEAQRIVKQQAQQPSKPKPQRQLPSILNPELNAPGIPADPRKRAERIRREDEQFAELATKRLSPIVPPMARTKDEAIKRFRNEREATARRLEREASEATIDAKAPRASLQNAMARFNRDNPDAPAELREKFKYRLQRVAGEYVVQRAMRDGMTLYDAGMAYMTGKLKEDPLDEFNRAGDIKAMAAERMYSPMTGDLGKDVLDKLGAFYDFNTADMQDASHTLGTIRRKVMPHGLFLNEKAAKALKESPDQGIRSIYHTLQTLDPLQTVDFVEMLTSPTNPNRVPEKDLKGFWQRIAEGDVEAQDQLIGTANAYMVMLASGQLRGAKPTLRNSAVKPDVKGTRGNVAAKAIPGEAGRIQPGKLADALDQYLQQGHAASNKAARKLPSTTSKPPVTIRGDISNQYEEPIGPPAPEPVAPAAKPKRTPKAAAPKTEPEKAAEPTETAPESPAKPTPKVGDRVWTQSQVSGEIVYGRVVQKSDGSAPYVLLSKGKAGARRWALDGNDWNIGEPPKTAKAPKAPEAEPTPPSGGTGTGATTRRTPTPKTTEPEPVATPEPEPVAKVEDDPSAPHNKTRRELADEYDAQHKAEVERAKQGIATRDAQRKRMLSEAVKAGDLEIKGKRLVPVTPKGKTTLKLVQDNADAEQAIQRNQLKPAEEILRRKNEALSNHAKSVDDAIKQGKQIRDDVLRDYPELAERYGRKIEPPKSEPTPAPKQPKPKVEPEETRPAESREVWERTVDEESRIEHAKALKAASDELKKAKAGQLETGAFSRYKSKSEAIRKLTQELQHIKAQTPETYKTGGDHFQEVSRALREGKPVPQRVLDSFPDELRKQLEDSANEGKRTGNGGAAKTTRATTAPKGERQTVGSGAKGEQGKTATELAAPQTTSKGRILPNPIKVPNPKNIDRIMRDVQRKLNKAVKVGKSFSRKVLGSYQPSNTRLVIRNFGDLDTAVHEVAHWIDDRFNIVGDWAKSRVRSPFDKELAHFWKHTSKPGYKLVQKRAEGVAEFIRAYAFDPDAARQLAPTFTKHFESMVPADVRAILDEFGVDVRGWAGSSNAQKIAGRIQFDKPSVLARVLHVLQPHNGSYTTPFVSRFIKRAMTDDLDPVVKNMEESMRRTGADVLPERNPLVLLRQLPYVKARFEGMLEYGMTNARNQIVGKPIMHILEPLNHSSRRALKAELEDTFKMMVAERTVELGDRGIKGGMLGGGIYDDVAIAQGYLDDLKADPIKLVRLQEAAARYRQWMDDVLDYAVEKGLYSKEHVKAVRDSNNYYVLFRRVVDDPLDLVMESPHKSGGNLGTTKKTLFNIKGSSRPIENPFTASIENAFNIVREADRNEVMLAWRDVLKGNNRRSMYAPDMVDTADLGAQIPSAADGSVKIIVNGKVEHWLFEAGTTEALKGVGRLYTMNFLERILAAPATAVRATVTRSPGFLVRNRIRDIGERLVKSETGSNIGDTIGRVTDDEAKNYKLYGGGIHSGKLLEGKVNYDKVQKRLIAQAIHDPKSIVLAPVHWYDNLATGSERAGRVAEVRSALREAKALGYDDYNAQLYAHFKARELIDFARAGIWSRHISRYVPFFNARTQGLARTLTVLRNQPGKFMTRWAGYVLTPTLANYAWNAAQGEDVLNEYRQLPAYVRQTFWNFKIPGYGWLRIPKPFELGMLATGVEYAVDRAYGNENAFDGYAKELALSLLPMDESSIFGGGWRGVAEVAVNRDLFRDKPIVPSYEADLNLDRREGAKHASRLGQLIGFSIGRDPRDIDHLIRYFGTDFGDMVMTLSDVWRDDKTIPTSKPLNLVTGLFTDVPAYGAIDVQKVLDEARGVGIRGLLKDELETFFEAKSNLERDKAAQALRAAATEIRKELEAATKGKKGKAYSDAVEDVLSGYVGSGED